jgi:bifunctional DNA-binding transcriptional regulator/antitoxin component of YhaV-PrlF toxin-antitoxin module
MLVTLQEDPTTGELILPLPEEVLDQLGLDIGDTLIWSVESNGSIILSKQGDTL